MIWSNDLRRPNPGGEVEEASWTAEGLGDGRGAKIGGDLLPNGHRPESAASLMRSEPVRIAVQKQ